MTKSAAVLGMLLGYVIYLAVFADGWLYVARLRKRACILGPEAVARMRALAEAAAAPAVYPPS